MKALSTTALAVGFLLIAASFAMGQQEYEGVKAEQLLPEFSIETLNQTAPPDETPLPFVYNGYIYAFSHIKRLPSWKMFLGGDLVNPFAVADGRLFVYDIFNRLYSIDLVKRKILWKTDIKDEIRGKPHVYGHYVIVSTQKGNLIILSVESGQVLSEHEGGSGILGGFTMFENLAIVPYKNGKVSAFNVETKTEVWVFNSGGVVSVPPVVSDSTVLFGAWDETFYALDVLTGKPLWTSYVGDDVSREFLVDGNLVVLFFSKGQVLCLEQADGEIRWVKYFDRVEFNYNYFQGIRKFFVFTPDFVAVSSESGEILYRYQDRAYSLFKEMLFENMIEGERLIKEGERNHLLSSVYFSVNRYPLMPPVAYGGSVVYFVTNDAYFYVYDRKEDFFTLKFKLF